MADEELKKAFQDLQFKTNETRALIAQGEHIKKVNTQKMKVSELSANALADDKNDLAVYRSVGRMFILTSKQDEIARHKSEAAEFGTKIESIDKQKEYLQRNIEEAEKNLREMIQARRAT